MASKLKIIPLGGLGEIGKNLTIYEYGKDMFLVDCGMGFPDQDLYGVDLVIPDISYLKANKNRIRGMVITHGHEDHIGAIPYVLKQLDMPIYATPLTAAIIELRLEEHDLLYHTQIFTKKPGDKFKLGCFEIEFIHTNHSIADSVALAAGEIPFRRHAVRVGRALPARKVPTVEEGHEARLVAAAQQGAARQRRGARRARQPFCRRFHPHGLQFPFWKIPEFWKVFEFWKIFETFQSDDQVAYHFLPAVWGISFCKNS